APQERAQRMVRAEGQPGEQAEKQDQRWRTGDAVLTKMFGYCDRGAIPMTKEFLFTSESVSEGHPHKVADQISDSVLDAILAQEPTGRVAAETLCSTGLVVLAGEITTSADVNYNQVARDTIKRIGY